MTMTTAPQSNKLEFMNGVKITLKKIPKHPQFEGAFVEKVDYTLCKMIIDKPDTFDQETVTGFNDAVTKNLKPDGSLVVVHNQLLYNKQYSFG